jgi:hypothetical protein
MNHKKWTRAEVRAALDDLVRRGLIVPTGEYRNGRPVYAAASLPEGWTLEMMLEARKDQ